MLSLSLMGPFQVTLNGVPATGFESDKARALLVYLVVESERPHTREKLAGLFWPDWPEDLARRNLRHGLSNLRKAIGDRQASPPFLQITRQMIQFNMASDYWLDVAVFKLIVDQLPSHPKLSESRLIIQLEEAVKLYRGPFLDGFSLKGSAAFEEWLLLSREQLQRKMLTTLAQISGYYERYGEYKAACDYAWRQVELEPWREEGHQQLMRLLALNGQRSKALAQYDTCRRLLAEEIGVEPAVETLALYEAIRDGNLSRDALKPGIIKGRELSIADEGGKVENLVLSPFPTFSTSPNPFVARERELTQLDQFLNLTVAGQGRVVFVTGEAGSGKTALVQEFARRVQTRYAKLIVAGGNCNAYVGVGDPYLPFREIMELLIADVDGKWTAEITSPEYTRRLKDLIPYTIETLISLGSDLIDIFISSKSLTSRVIAPRYDSASWLSQVNRVVARKEANQGRVNLNQIDLFEQYTKVVQTLAQRQPLLLVLDDLQWADVGSISLLFHLGRRLQNVPILIVGIYRPSDVALGREGERHPLILLVNEFQRQFGNIWVDLEQTAGKRFVDAFLDSEPNQLGDIFREALYQRTRGQALFTIEMVAGMQARGDLVKDNLGRWVETSTVDWGTLPPRVEGIIRERISRLPAGLQEMLKVASVEGENFTAEVIAQVRAVDESNMMQHLSGELHQQHRLVRSQGSRRLGDQRLSYYRFSHILFQKYLYHSLDEVERVYLHEAVGKVLEKIYGEQTDEVAVQLARHFQEAGLLAKAIEYLHQAGARAVRLFAHEEAIEHFNQGLTLLKSLPNNPERIQQELNLQLVLGTSWLVTRGYAAPEVEQSFGRAWELCGQIGETLQLFPTLEGLFLFHMTRGHIQIGRKLGEQCLRLAQEAQAPMPLLEAHRLLVVALFWLGEFTLAQEHSARGIALYDFKQHHALVSHYGQDPGIVCFIYSALALWVLGYPDQALDRANQALTLARASNPNQLAATLFLAAMLYQFCRDNRSAQEYAKEAVNLSTEQRFPLWLAGGKITLGWAMTELHAEVGGQGYGGKEGLAQIEEGLAIWRSAGGELIVSYFLAVLAEAHRKVGQIKAGLMRLAEALELVNKTGERAWEAELYRLRGELLWMQEMTEAEACFRQAIEIARQQEAKSLELRATVSLCRLWQQQGKREEACRMLAEVYGWFTEGFDTPDLQEAKALLEKSQHL